MPKQTRFEMCLRRLAIGPVQPGMMDKEEALTYLKRMTGQDFGTDIRRWEEWGFAHPEVSGMWPDDESDMG